MPEERRVERLSGGQEGFDSFVSEDVATSRTTLPAPCFGFFYTIKKEGAPASFRLKTSRSTISRESKPNARSPISRGKETKEHQY